LKNTKKPPGLLLMEYLIPCPPHAIDDSGEDALEARSENSKWLGENALTFTFRWACISFGSWALVWSAMGNNLWIEIPMALIGSISGVVAVWFYFIHRRFSGDK
jgi:sensor c-di-GMP phosphodiesterase-like protein